jgi:PAS domain S-box-containing protein
MSSRTRVRVAVADDDVAVRDALSDLIRSRDDLQLAGVASDHSALLALVVSMQPDVVLMDIRMPQGDGSEAIRHLRATAPTTAVIVVSASDQRETFVAAVEAGASGYLVKGGSDEELLEAVARAHRGQFSAGVSLVVESVNGLRRDLAHSRRGEDTARMRGILLDRLLGSAPVASVLVAPGGGIRFASAQTQRMFARAAEDLIGQPATTLFSARCQTGLLALLTSAEEAGSGVHSELVGLRGDGSEFAAIVEMNLLTKQDGPCIGLYVRDLTEATTDTETRYRRLVECAPDALLLIDDDRQIVLVNAQAEQMFGLDRNELLTGSLEQLIPDVPADLFPGGGSAVPLQGWPGPESSLALTARHTGGEEFPVAVRLAVLRSEDGTFVVATLRNMGEARRHERVIEQSLQHLVDVDRAHHLLLSHLVRAQEEERKRISVGIHDDTLQAMTAASLRAQQLRRRLRDSSDLKVVGKLEETIRQSILRLRHLLFDLRPPASGQGGLGEALLGYLEHLNGNRNTWYRVDDLTVEAIPPQTRVIAYRIAQEALTNSWLHADADTVTVQMSDVDDGLLLAIKDDGAGYDPAQAENKPDHLGLTLMKERAHLAGGWCRIESSPGHGTVVQCWLPRTNDPVDETPQHPPRLGDA